MIRQIKLIPTYFGLWYILHLSAAYKSLQKQQQFYFDDLGKFANFFRVLFFMFLIQLRD